MECSSEFCAVDCQYSSSFLRLILVMQMIQESRPRSVRKAGTMVQQSVTLTSLPSFPVLLQHPIAGPGEGESAYTVKLPCGTQLSIVLSGEGVEKQEMRLRATITNNILRLDRDPKTLPAVRLMTSKECVWLKQQRKAQEEISARQARDRQQQSCNKQVLHYRVWDGVLTFDFRVSTFDFREKALLLKLSQVDPSKRENPRRNKVTSATGSAH